MLATYIAQKRRFEKKQNNFYITSEIAIHLGYMTNSLLYSHIPLPNSYHDFNTAEFDPKQLHLTFLWNVYEI